MQSHLYYEVKGEQVLKLTAESSEDKLIISGICGMIVGVEDMNRHHRDNNLALQAVVKNKQEDIKGEQRCVKSHQNRFKTLESYWLYKLLRKARLLP